MSTMVMAVSNPRKVDASELALGRISVGRQASMSSLQTYPMTVVMDRPTLVSDETVLNAGRIVRMSGLIDIEGRQHWAELTTYSAYNDAAILRVFE